MGLVDLLLGVAPAAVQALLLAILYRRGLHRRGRFPCFFAYNLFSILATLFRHVFIKKPLLFFILYWATEAGYGILAILSLNEVFRHIFELDYKENWWMRWLLPGTAVLVGVGSLWHILHAGPSVHGRPTAVILGFDLGVHSVEAVILLLFTALRWLLAAAWSKYDYRVLVGFGISAYFILSIDTAWAHMSVGRPRYLPIYVPTIGYLIAVLIWLHAFWRPPEPGPKSQIAISDVLDLLGRQAAVFDSIRKWLGLNILNIL